MMDYIDLDDCYVLMLVDKFSRLVEFVVADSPTAITACNGTVAWSSRYGLPAWIISDGGSHFHNWAMRLVAEKMGLEHQITLAYCPWANGAVEIVGRELLWTMRALVSEKGYSATDAKKLLSLVQFVLNHREREVLGGRTPIQVMTGQAPTTALQLVLWEGHLLKEAKYHIVELKQVEAYCEKLAAALDIMHQEISDAEEVKRRAKAAKQVNADRAMNFEIGDLVMMTAWGNAAHVKRSHKLGPTWQGPYEVVQAISATTYGVQLLGRPDKDVKKVHWSRMKRFGGADFDVTERLKRTAVNDCQRFDVQSFQEWRCNDDGTMQLRVRWQGVEPHDDTWQDIDDLHNDVPVLVRNYLRDHQGEDDRLDEAAARLQ